MLFRKLFLLAFFLAVLLLAFNPILPVGGEGGVLSATVFGDWLLLLNSCTCGIVTSWLFLNIYPNPPPRGVLKKWFFFKIGRKPKLQNSICRTHKERTKSRRWSKNIEQVTAIFVGQGMKKSHFLQIFKCQYLVEILRYVSNFWQVIITPPPPSDLRPWV